MFMKKKTKAVSAFLCAILVVAIVKIPHANAEVVDFNDVSEDSWYWNYSQTSYKYGLFNGTAPNTFSPNNAIHRADFVTALGRLYELSESELIEDDLPNRFDDVDTGTYYSKYINWAADMGIVSGYGNNKFGPYDYTTRQEMAKILYNYIILTDSELNAEPGSVMEFADLESISSWAGEAVSYLQKYSIVQGSKGNFYPTHPITRAEAAAVYVRLCDLINPDINTLA